MLQEAWEKAVVLAQKFVPERAVEVVSTVGPRLGKQLGRYEAAGDHYCGVEMYREAIESYVHARAWDKARACSRDMAPAMQDHVEEQYIAHLQENADTDALMGVDVIAALDMLAEQGDWVQCMKKAKSEGGQVLRKYAAVYAGHLLQEGDPLAALAIFREHGAPATPQVRGRGECRVGQFCLGVGGGRCA